MRGEEGGNGEAGGDKNVVVAVVGLMVGPRPDQATRPRSASRCGGTDNEAAAVVVVVDVQGKLGGHIFYTTSWGIWDRSTDIRKEGGQASSSLPSFLPYLGLGRSRHCRPSFFHPGRPR